MFLLKPVVFIFTPFIRVFYRLRAVGRENIPQSGRMILVCNHIHVLDPTLVGSTCGRLFRSMAKDSLFNNPLSAFFIRGLGGFPVKRGKGDVSAIKTAREVLREERMLLIFPEGTRSKSGEMQSLKSGALLLSAMENAPIVPAYISAERRFLIPFRRTVIAYGPPILPAELGLEPGLERYNPDELQAARAILAERMLALKQEV